MQPLSPRQRAVAELLLAGYEPGIIGVRLGMATRTVHNHAARIIAKIEAAQRRKGAR